MGSRPVLRGRAAALAACLATVLVVGCSSDDNFEKPAPLPDVEQDVRLKKVWSTSIGSGMDDQLLFLQPAIHTGILYAADARGRIEAIDAQTGKRQWRHALDEPLLAGVGVDHRHVFVANRRAEVIALDLAERTVAWRHSVSSEVLAPPQSNGALVVVQTVDGKLFGLDAEDGERRWQYDSVAPVLSFRGTATPWVGAEVTIAAFANGQLMAFGNEDGRPLWQYTVSQPQGRTELERLVDVDGTPLVIDDVVYVAGYQGRLAALDLNTGQELWSRPGGSLQSPATDSGNAYVALSDGSVVAYNLYNRSEVWKNTLLSWRRLTAPVAAGRNLLVGDFEGYLHVIAQQDGRIRGRVRVDSDGLRVPFLRLDDLYIAYGNSGDLVAYRVQDE